MRLVRAAELEGIPGSQPTTITGSAVLRPIAEFDGDAPEKVSLVQFQPGARTQWHYHEAGQVLLVVDGVAVIESADGARVEAQPGDLVVSDPGERHWHGAGPAGPAAHLAVSRGVTVWFEPVED